ncbi:glycosyl hydrolase family 61-domain-containing protein [Aspergillus venezuelensis]
MTGRSKPTDHPERTPSTPWGLPMRLLGCGGQRVSYRLSSRTWQGFSLNSLCFRALLGACIKSTLAVLCFLLHLVSHSPHTLFFIPAFFCPGGSHHIHYPSLSLKTILSLNMKSYGLLALAAIAKLASAHATVMAVWINDEDQGLGNTADGYIRSPPSNSPVTDVTSTDLTCNVNGQTAAAKTLEVAAGDKITFEWHHNTRDASDDIIDLSHLGPVLVYMAPTEAGSAGSGWVKIAEDGYADGTWAVETLVANKGKHSITVPDVPAGDYLFRPEIIALHEGNREGGAQLYMECVQFTVTSDGASTLPEGVSLPGAYAADDAGILFDIYNSFDNYPIPGPAVWDGASSGGSGSGSGSSSTASATSTATATESKAPSTSSVAPTTTAAPSTTTTATATQTQTSIATFTTSVKPTTTAAPTSTVAPTTTAAPTSTAPATGGSTGTGQIYQQCGGINFKGAAGCASGLTCKQWNPYYYQCIQE